MISKSDMLIQWASIHQPFKRYMVSKAPVRVKHPTLENVVK